MIVKLQRPLASNDKDPPWMVYDHKRKYQAMISDADIPDRIKSAMRADPKGYFSVSLDSSGRLTFGNRLIDQKW
jgi:hypothetical protein